MIVQPPTPRLLMACELLDEMVGCVAKCKQRRVVGWAVYESTPAASSLLNLAIRDVEAMCALARVDMVLAPAACVLGRAVFEICVRMQWMLLPDAVFEREARWLALLREEERLWERTAKMARDHNLPAADAASLEQHIYAFRSGVEEKLRQYVDVKYHVPNMREFLKEQGVEASYVAYVELSQFVHGGHRAMMTYQRNLGTLKEFFEPTPQAHERTWFDVLRLSWWSFRTAADRYAELGCTPETTCGSMELRARLDEALRALPLEGA